MRKYQRKKLNIQETILSVIWKDKGRGKPYTITDNLRKIKVDGKGLKHSQVSGALYNLKKFDLIVKPEGSTKQDGKWTMTDGMYVKYIWRFGKNRKRFKRTYCRMLKYSHKLQKRVCLVTNKIICNPECSCIQLRATVFIDGQYTKQDINLCPGFTQCKSTKENIDVCRELIINHIKKDLDNFILAYSPKTPIKYLRPELISHLPYTFRSQTDLFLPAE